VTDPRPARRGVLLAAIAFVVLAWASAFIVIRGVAPVFGPGALALGRLAVGVVVLAVIVGLSRSWVRPTGREWALLVLYGAGWFGAYNLLLNLAEHTLDAGTAAMVVNVGPALITLGGALLLGERITGWIVAGVLVALAGAAIIGIATSSGQPLDVVGVLAALGAAVVYAAGVLAQKPVLRRLPAAQTTFLGAAIGFVVCLPFAPELVAELAVAPPAATVGMVYLGVVPTALAFAAWSYALARMSAGRLGVTTYLVPPLAIVIGALALGETPGWLALLGGVLCLAGVALARRAPRPVPASVENLPE